MPDCSLWYLCGIQRFDIVSPPGSPPALAATERRAVSEPCMARRRDFCWGGNAKDFTSKSTFETGNPRTAWWRQLCLSDTIKPSLAAGKERRIVTTGPLMVRRKDLWWNGNPKGIHSSVHFLNFLFRNSRTSCDLMAADFQPSFFHVWREMHFVAAFGLRRDCHSGTTNSYRDGKHVWVKQCVPTFHKHVTQRVGGVGLRPSAVCGARGARLAGKNTQALILSFL